MRRLSQYLSLGVYGSDIVRKRDESKSPAAIKLPGGVTTNGAERYYDRRESPIQKYGSAGHELRLVVRGSGEECEEYDCRSGSFEDDEMYPMLSSRGSTYSPAVCNDVLPEISGSGQLENESNLLSFMQEEEKPNGRSRRRSSGYKRMRLRQKLNLASKPNKEEKKEIAKAAPQQKESQNDLGAHFHRKTRSNARTMPQPSLSKDAIESRSKMLTRHRSIHHQFSPIKAPRDIQNLKCESREGRFKDLDEIGISQKQSTQMPKKEHLCMDEVTTVNKYAAAPPLSARSLTGTLAKSPGAETPTLPKTSRKSIDMGVYNKMGECKSGAKCQPCPKENSNLRSQGRSLFHNFFRKHQLNSLSSRKAPSEKVTTMGAAMRKQCCGGRDDGDVKSKAHEKMKEQGWDFLQGEAVANDLTLFDDAHSKNDIPSLVKLLDSEQPFERNDTQIHPWASRPESICSLAAFQLAQMASKEAQSPCKDAIREAGGIKKLVALINSKKVDRQHSAMVALSFLSVENEQNCIEMFECGAMPIMVKYLRDPVEGMQGACAHTLRNIYVIDLLYRQKFVAEGGVAPLVSLLDIPKGKYDPMQLFNQSEAVFHIEDLILESGAEMPQFVASVRNAGVAKKLEALTKVENEQLVQDARELLIRFAD